jgi:ADP-ribose pyrophosphatase YjhB (NUDIX family)
VKYLLLLIRYCVVVAQRALYYLTLGQAPPPFVGASVAVLRDNKILLLNRKDGFGLCLPGGFSRLFETIEQTARREVFEETGISVEIKQLLMILSGKRPGTKIAGTEIIYCGETNGETTPQSSFEGKSGWYDLATIKPEQIAFDHFKVIEKLRTF